MFDGYRPAGRPAAGTAGLDDVLGAIGFQKLANTNGKLFQKVRVRIEVELKDGRHFRVLIYPSYLVNALDSVRRELPAVDMLRRSNLPTPPVMAYA